LSNAPTQTRRSVADLEPGEHIDEALFLIIQKELRTTANGGLYIHAVLADRTGQLLARMWNATQTMYNSLPARGLVTVRGRVESYKGKPQFIIDAIRAHDGEPIDPAQFLPATEYDVDGMWNRALEILRTIKHADLLALVGQFINDETFATAYRRAPAARTNHHACVGGLLEHTLNLLELAVLVLPRYPDVNADLVLAGIFLHDAGKIAELSCDVSFDYTDAGQLLGHIVQATIWVQERANRIAAERGRPIDRHVLLALQHVIVSHHGKYEFGSPRLPATAEAYMVHYLDNLDARLNMVFNAIAEDPDTESDWTRWIPALETRVYKPDVTAAKQSEPRP
jgi:3'-5' exoribonuclease